MTGRSSTSSNCHCEQTLRNPPHVASTSPLAWKEWRERRASLYLATAWIAGWLVYMIVYEVATGIRGPVGRFYSVCLFYGLFAPVFLAMRTALGERTQGTFGFSASLPASLRQQAAVRVLGGLVTLTAPIALGAIVLSGILLTGAIEQSGFRPPPETNYLDFPKRPSISRMEAVGARLAIRRDRRRLGQ